MLSEINLVAGVVLGIADWVGNGYNTPLTPLKRGIIALYCGLPEERVGCKRDSVIL